MLDKDYLIKGDMYQYNLGWLIEQLMSFKQDLATAIDLKTIKYADPIQWDITTQYPANTVVVDPKNGTAYMSKVPVPAGVELTNLNYWVVVFNYQDIYNKIMDGIAFNDRDQDYATKDLLVNDLVWYAGDLYRVARAIPTGSKYIPGTNLIKTTIESLLARYYGRDRTAQVSNDTVNVSGDYTLNAGDITVNADNNTQKIVNDYELDVDKTAKIKAKSIIFDSISPKYSAIYDTIADIPILKEGTIVDTMGYFIAGDAGAARYIARSSEPSVPYTRNVNGQYLELVFNNTVNAMALGCRNNKSEDISKILNNILSYPIYFPSGDYLIADNLTFSEIIGESKEKTNLYATKGISFNAIHSTLSNITLWGSDNNSMSGYDGITLINAGIDFRIENCIINFYNNGITINPIIWVSKFYNVRFNRCGTGINSPTSGSRSLDIIFELVYFNNCSSYDVNLNNFSSVTFLNCNFGFSATAQCNFNNVTCIFISCNFENDLVGTMPLFIIGKGSYTFENCFFAPKLNGTTGMFAVADTPDGVKFIACRLLSTDSYSTAIFNGELSGYRAGIYEFDSQSRTLANNLANISNANTIFIKDNNVITAYAQFNINLLAEGEIIYYQPAASPAIRIGSHLIKLTTGEQIF